MCTACGADCILSKMILQKTLLGMDSSIMLLQLLHSLRFPVFGVVTIKPVFHSVGITAISQILLRRWYRTSVVAVVSALVQSVRGNVVNTFSFLMALVISSFEIGRISKDEINFNLLHK